VELSLARRNGRLVIVAIVDAITPALREPGSNQQGHYGARN
jgi:hypothetical protein